METKYENMDSKSNNETSLEYRFLRAFALKDVDQMKFILEQGFDLESVSNDVVFNMVISHGDRDLELLAFLQQNGFKREDYVNMGVAEYARLAELSKARA